MPGDTTESREPMLEEARESLAAAYKVGLPNPTDEYRDALMASAQVEATLAVAEELRALRESFSTPDGYGIGRYLQDAILNVERAFTDAADTVSAQAMRRSR